MRTLLLALIVAACGNSDDMRPVDAAAGSDGTDAVDAASGDKAAACASTFGSALTDAFGRVDATVLAVVPPSHSTCAQPNSSHVVIQVVLNGAAYRMVVNLNVLAAELDAPLAGPAWSEGWHTDAVLDYVSTLQVASSTFTMPADAVAYIADNIAIGSHISVFGTSSGGIKADSAHLIHRNKTGEDGAIVIDADTAPHYVLFRFANQLF
jgi:hypothetical protein